MFKRNVGGLDAIFRIGIGIALIYISFFNTSLLEDQLASYILGIFGAIVFLSGVFRSCPLYNLIGFSSCKTE